MTLKYENRQLPRAATAKTNVRTKAKPVTKEPAQPAIKPKKPTSRPAKG